MPSYKHNKREIPSLEEIESCDRLKVLYISRTSAEQEDLRVFFYPYLTGIKANGFLADNEIIYDIYNNVMTDNVTIQVFEYLKEFSVGLIHMFNKIVIQISDFPKVYVLVEDDGETFRISQYEYFRHDDTMRLLFGVDSQDKRWVWTYETNKRIINIKTLLVTKDHIVMGTPVIDGKITCNKNFHGVLFYTEYINAVNEGKMDKILLFNKAAIQSGTYTQQEINLIESKKIRKEDKLDILTRSFQSDIIELIIDYCVTVYYMQFKREIVDSSNGKNNKSHIKKYVRFTESAEKDKKNIIYKLNINRDKFHEAMIYDVNSIYGRRYHTERWGVAGYQRTYKSGKVAWIKPSERKRRSELLDSNASERKKRTYILKK